jgi:hypothetical protein
MHKKGMLEGFPLCNLEIDFHENCIYGKQNQFIFSSRATRARDILELIHIEIFRHISIPSLGEYLHYVSFIDYFSRKTWLYFMRKKLEVFDKFKEFKYPGEN